MTTITSIADLVGECGLALSFEDSDEEEEHVAAPPPEERRTELLKKSLSAVFENTPMHSLTEDDLKVHYRNKLGEGAFCTVYPCHVRNRKTNDFNESLPPFAMKKLRTDLKSDPEMLKEAYNDLLQEATIMKELQHENLIPLYGMSEPRADIPMEKFFIVVETLESTLDKKIEKWAKIRGPIKKMTPKDTVTLRMEGVVLGIAQGLEYIHSRRMIYRDLKPANVGFEYSGRVKIFDFGLATRLPEGKHVKIRGKAGTLRYMAPEISRNKPYDFAVDVYSFAVLVWQIVTSRTPFEKEIPKMDFGAPKEIPPDKRPNLKYIENKELAALLEVCWHEDPTQRWIFNMIVPELRRIIKVMEDRPSKKKNRRARPVQLSSFKIN